MKKIILFLSVILIGCSDDISSETSEFNQVCKAFEVLSQYESLSSLSAEERDVFIAHEIRGISQDGNARAGLDAVKNAVAEERYDFYKSVVDSIEGGDWSCDAMKNLIPSIETAYTEKDLKGEKAPEPVSLEDASF